MMCFNKLFLKGEIKVKFKFISFFLSLFSFVSILDASVSSEWAEKTLAAMSLEEKIGQLFMVAAYSNPDDAKIEEQNEAVVASVEQLIRDFHVGGILLKHRWEPLIQVHLVRHFQAISTIPLLIAQDCEWGLAMRSANTIAFPRNMTLGAIQDDRLIYALGREIGRQCALVGVNVNLAPVVDVNSNPTNPVIGMRSFGDNSENVACKGVALMQGIQKEGVIACAKHFPGHGDTNLDSHDELPFVLNDRAHFNKTELYPFKKMIEAGVMAVMSAHVVAPALDPCPHLPASLSHVIMTETLQKEMGFDGLIITDDLMMGAIAKHYPAGEAALQAFLAGCDVLLSTRDIPKCYAKIQQAVADGVIRMEDLDRRVLKILQAKQWIQMLSSEKAAMLQEDGDWSLLQSKEALSLKKTLFQDAMTVVNSRGLIPLSSPLNEWACFQIGGDSISGFYQTLQKNQMFPCCFIGEHPSEEEMSRFVEKASSYQHLLIALYPKKSTKSSVFGLSFSAIQCVKELCALGKPVIIVVFGSPYLVPLFNSQTLVVAYEGDPLAQQAAVEVLLGKISAKGKLPVSFEN